MTYQRLAYDDASPVSEMTSDCRVVESALRLPQRRSSAERAASAALRPAPSIAYADFPREVGKPAITVSAAAARLAAAMHMD